MHTHTQYILQESYKASYKVSTVEIVLLQWYEHYSGFLGSSKASQIMMCSVLKLAVLISMIPIKYKMQWQTANHNI